MFPFKHKETFQKSVINGVIELPTFLIIICILINQLQDKQYEMKVIVNLSQEILKLKKIFDDEEVQDRVIDNTKK